MFVSVGLRYISISILSGCVVNCRLGCVLFMRLWIVSGVVCFAFYIFSMKSTYLV
jgi:hypothetical protein